MTGGIIYTPRLGCTAVGSGPARRGTTTAAVARDQPGSRVPAASMTKATFTGTALTCYAAKLYVLDGRRCG